MQSFTSSTAYSQYRYGRVWAGNQMDQTATRSSFEQRHRIVAQGSYTFPTQTTLSVIYTGSSGIPYNFVYNSDLNGDGLSYNDPIYVPTDATDPNQIMFQDFTSTTPTATRCTRRRSRRRRSTSSSTRTPACAIRGARSWPGTLAPRPWTNLLNVSVRQSLRTFNMQNVSLELDVFNFLNLLNKNWGKQGTDTYSDVSLLTYRGLSNGSGSTLYAGDSQPVLNFDPSRVTIANYDNLQSNYQIQLSLRYTF